MPRQDFLTFAGRVGIVTGGGRGMGKEHCLLLAARGAKVIVNDVDAQHAQQTVDEIAAAGGVATAVVKDISSAQGARDLIDETIAIYERIDILVSNAAVINSCSMADMTAERFDALFAVNAHGPFYLCIAAWPHFVRQKYGRVLLVGSDAALAGQPMLTHYSASKGAVIGMVRSLSLEGVADGIHVNGLIPVAYTDMTRHAVEAGTVSAEDGARQEKALAAHLVSPVAAWLCHEECDTNGELWQAGAGRVAREFIGAAPGYYDPGLTMESLRDNVEQVEDRNGYAIPRDCTEMFAWIVKNSYVR